jgi:hypothetical protein
LDAGADEDAGARELRNKMKNTHEAGLTLVHAREKEE